MYVYNRDNMWYVDGLIQLANDPKSSQLQPSNARGVELWFRVRLQADLVKLVLCHGRLIGVTLIGETDLEEVFENLILNKTDLTSLGPDILHADNDIEDYFDWIKLNYDLIYMTR